MKIERPKHDAVEHTPFWKEILPGVAIPAGAMALIVTVGGALEGVQAKSSDEHTKVRVTDVSYGDNVRTLTTEKIHSAHGFVATAQLVVEQSCEDSSLVTKYVSGNTGIRGGSIFVDFDPTTLSAAECADGKLTAGDPISNPPR